MTQTQSQEDYKADHYSHVVKKSLFPCHKEAHYLSLDQMGTIITNHHLYFLTVCHEFSFISSLKNLT